MTARNDLLADLADDIRQLTEPRHNSEMREAVERDGQKRRRVRRPHTITMPSLLQCLTDCLTPATSGDGAAIGAAFDSKPSADLEPLRVYRAIEDGADHWCRTLGVYDRHTVTGRLSALVSAGHTDQQLEQVHRDVRSWVKQARVATGWDAPSFTLSGACPNCFRKNTLTISGDLDYARCGRCRMEWPHDLIGILSQQIQSSQTEETVRAGVCGEPMAAERCYLTAGHADPNHVTPTGRYWPRPEQDIA